MKLSNLSKFCEISIAGVNNLNYSKAFIEYSNDMDDIYKNIEEYKPNNKRKILIALDNIIADTFCKKKPSPFVTELFIRGIKLNIYLSFITQCYFFVPENIILNSTHNLL